LQSTRNEEKVEAPAVEKKTTEPIINTIGRLFAQEGRAALEVTMDERIVQATSIFRRFHSFCNQWGSKAL
jgi:hypothetical protein